MTNFNFKLTQTLSVRIAVVSLPAVAPHVVVDHGAQGVHAAAAGTGIPAAVVLANLAPRALVIAKTLGLRLRRGQRDLLGEALLVGVALVVALAGAHGTVVLDSTRGSESAESGTGTVALEPDARLTRRALVVAGAAADGLAAGVGDRVAGVSLVAGAEGLAVGVGEAVGIVSAGVGRAGVADDDGRAAAVGVALVAVAALAAPLSAEDDGAVGVGTAGVLGAGVGLWLDAAEGGGVLGHEAGQALADRAAVDLTAVHVGAAGVRAAHLLRV